MLNNIIYDKQTYKIVKFGVNAKIGSLNTELYGITQDNIDIGEFPIRVYSDDGVVKAVKSLPSRQEQVAQIVVTTSTGKVFDGDELSQDRMIRAINIASITGLATTEWKMYDNSIQSVTLAELQEALTLAGQEMSRIWLGA